MSYQTDHHRVSCMEVWGGNSRTQKSLDITGFDIWINSIPHDGNSQGGDIYYLSSCGAGDIARFSLADVSGHGEAASYLAKRLRRLMRRYINTLDQQQFAQSLNADFSKLSRRGKYATALLAAYHAVSDYLVICNAGHPRPLLYRFENDTWQYLDHKANDCLDDSMNLPLGIIKHTDYRQYGLKLLPGDILIMYTDAVLEARHDRGDSLGETGLLALLDTLPTESARHSGEELLTRLEAYGNIHDDLTLMVLAHNGSDPVAPSWQERLRGIKRMISPT